MQRGMKRRVAVVLLGAALGAGSLPLDAHADRDGKRRHERRSDRKEARDHDRRDRDRDRDHAWHRERDSRRGRDYDRHEHRDRRESYRRHRDRDECEPRRVVVRHHDRVVYVPRPVRSGITWAIYASNLPPAHYDYWDPYCERSYGSLRAYRRHLHHTSHPHVIHVLDDDGYTVCGYRNRGGDSWVQVTLAGGIRF